MKAVVCVGTGRAHLDPPDAYYDKLRRSFPNVRFDVVTDPAALIPALADADVLFAPLITMTMLEAAPKLAWYHSSAIQFGPLVTDDVFQARVRMTNSRGAFAPVVAENILGAALSLAHRMAPAKEAYEQERKAGAMALMRTQRLKGKRMCIIGLGSNGRAVAHAARAFGMRVSSTKRDATTKTPKEVEELLPPAQLKDILPKSQIVAVTAPLTPETAGLIDEAALALLPEHAVVVNAGKPEIVVDADVIAALEGGRLAGYACDDMVPEESPLRTTAKTSVLLFPHAGPGDPQFWSGVFSIFAENMKRFLAGRELVNPINRELQY